MSWDADPVVELGLVGTPVGSTACAYQVVVRSRLYGREYEPCGQYAMLLRYPPPYGVRSVCEDGHQVPFPYDQVPTRTDLKDETD